MSHQGALLNPGVVNVLLLAPLRTGSGNCSTAGRIRKHFEGGGVCFNLRGTSSFTCPSEFRDFLSDNQIHVILALHCYHAGQWLQYIDANEIPYAVIFGGTDINEYNKVQESLRLMSQIVREASNLVVFSDAMLKKAKHHWPRLDCSKVREIPQSVITTPANRNVLETILEKYHLDKENKMFTLIGGIRPVKDPLYLCQAFSEWHQMQNSSSHLLIVGHVVDNDYAEQFYSIIDGCPGVLYVGGLSTYETHAIIRDSFALVNTSISEGMCGAILEAMDLGIPVLARGNAGNRALIQHNETGMIFSDPQEFIQSAGILLTKADVRQRIIQKAKRMVLEKHNLDDEKCAYLDLLEHLKSLRPEPKPVVDESEDIKEEDEAVEEEVVVEEDIQSNFETVAEVNHVVDKPKSVRQKARLAVTGNGNRRGSGEVDAKKNGDKVHKLKKGQKTAGGEASPPESADRSKSGKKTVKKTENGIKSCKKSVSPCAENRTSLEVGVETTKRRQSPNLNGTSPKSKGSKGQSSPRGELRAKGLKDGKKVKKL